GAASRSVAPSSARKRDRGGVVAMGSSAIGESLLPGHRAIEGDSRYRGDWVMRRLAGLVTALILAGGLAACGDKGKDEPDARASGETVATPTAASQAAPSPTPPPVAFFQCRSCHSVEPGRN